MDEILKEFYSEDDSYRSLAVSDQIDLFQSWADKRNLDAELDVVISRKHVIGVVVSLGLFVASFFVENSGLRVGLSYSLGTAGYLLFQIQQPVLRHKDESFREEEVE